MPKGIKKTGVGDVQYPHDREHEPHRVAARLEGVVKNKGTKNKKKQKRA